MPENPPEMDVSSNPNATTEPNGVEYDLRRYEARMGFWKVAVGTTLVGLASVLVPGAIEFWDLQFKSARQDVELEISKAAARRDEITTFIQYALNEDIELRLRMAEYFSVVTKGNPNDATSDQARWAAYYKNLSSLRDRTKNRILDLEKMRARLERRPNDTLSDDEAIELIALDLELKWLYGELGRAARGKSVIATANETPPVGNEANCLLGEKLISRDNSLENLHPEIRNRVTIILDRLHSEGIPFHLFEGFRSPFRQELLYSKGRTKPGVKVTWIAPWASIHQYGLAVDLVLRTNDDKWSWDTSVEKKDWWDRMHVIAQEEGMAPVYNNEGKVYELPHIQLEGVRTKDLQVGNFPDGSDEVWANNLANNLHAWQTCGRINYLGTGFVESLQNVSRMASNK